MSNLTRYNLEWFNRTHTMDNFHQMVASDDGAWVKFDEVKAFLQTSHNTNSPKCPPSCLECCLGEICNVRLIGSALCANAWQALQASA